MREKWFRLALWLGIFCIVIVCGNHAYLCSAATKQDNVIELNIVEETGNPQAEIWMDYEEGSLCLRLSYGQDGVLRAGRDFVMKAELLALGTSFHGEIHILMLNEQENHVSYTVALSAAAGEKGTAELILPLNLLTGALCVTLTDTDNTTVVEHMLYPEIVNLGTYLNVGVWLPKGSADYLESFGNDIHYLNKSNFTNDYKSLDAYDVLIMEEEEMHQLSEEESLALKQWVERGRLLILTASAEEEAAEEMTLNLGLQEKVIVQSLIGHISEYEAERNTVLLQNEERKKKYGDGAKTTYIGDSMLGPVLVNTLSDEAVKRAVSMPEWDAYSWWSNPGEDLWAIWQERGLPLIQQYACGDGAIEYVAFSLQTESKKIYPLFYYRLAELLYENLPEALETQLQYEQYGMTVSEPVYLLDYFEKRGESVSVLPYLIILAVYICICLPLLFWWLKRIGRTKYLWGVFPATAFVFLLMVYGVGNKSRVKEVFCTYLNVMDYTAAENQGTMYFELSLPTHKEAEIVLCKEAQVTLAETMFLSRQAEWNLNPTFSESILQEREYRIGVTLQEGQTLVSVQNVAAFSKTALCAEYKLEEAPDFEFEVTWQEDGLYGSVSNGETVSCEMAVLCVDGVLVNLGSLEAGEEKLLEEMPQYEVTAIEELYSDETLNWLFDEVGVDYYSVENGKYWFLLEELWKRQLEGSYLVVFSTDTAYTLLTTVASAKHSAGMNVILLPVEVEKK